MRGAVLAAASLVAALSHAAAGQIHASSYAEYRLDAIVGDGTTVQAGGGLTLPMGNYVRLGLTGAAGSTWHGGTAALTGRTDVIARFTFDPLREVPWALSLGGGLSVPVDAERTPIRPYVVAVVDVEGRKRGALTPAFQLGLGGGTRIGLILRASPARTR